MESDGIWSDLVSLEGVGYHRFSTVYTSGAFRNIVNSRE